MRICDPTADCHLLLPGRFETTSPVHTRTHAHRNTLFGCFMLLSKRQLTYFDLGRPPLVWPLSGRPVQPIAIFFAIQRVFYFVSLSLGCMSHCKGRENDPLLSDLTAHRSRFDIKGISKWFQSAPTSNRLRDGVGEKKLPIVSGFPCVCFFLG